MTFAIMQSPRHRRVYLEQAGVIAANELIFMGRGLSRLITDVREEYIGGVPYILFKLDNALTPKDIRLLSRLSFTHALFEVQGKLLLPIEKDCGYFIDEDISAILKYSGKTNELFTRLMLNLALAELSAASKPSKSTALPKSNPIDEPLRLLDPMAGKGTTLYEGLMQGLDVYGIEIDPKPPYESYVYIKKHLEMARYKHTSHTEKTSGTDATGSKFTATRYQVEMSPTKEEQKSGNTRRFEMIAGDTRNANAFHKKNFFHAIVTDLPYGVQHGAKKKPPTHGREGGLTRNALGLISEAMPGWVKVLKPGGVVVLAWNLFLISREQMEQLFADNGLTISEEMAELDFSHRLDQATNRDLIIGVKH